jgi:hypothetical protein
MIRRRPPAPQSDDEAVGLSGWLYADLILGLAVVFLALVVFVPRDTGDSTADQTPPTTTVDLAPTVASLEDRVESLTAEKAKLLEQITHLEEQAQSLDSDNENFLNRIAELEEQAESLDSEIEKLLDHIAELEDQTEIADLREQTDSLQTEIADLEKQANSLQVERTIKAIELARLGETNDALQEQLHDAELRASRGVEQNFYCFRIEDAGRPDKKDLAQQVYERLEGMDLEDREAGIVLTFGVGFTTDIGIPLAESFNEDVLSHDLLTPVLGGAVLRAFWNGVPDTSRGKPEGSVEVDLYLWQEEDQSQASGTRC